MHNEEMGVVIKPIVTEKMTKMSGDKNGRFAFYVDKNANKLEIKSELEALYGVTILSVNTCNVVGKKKSRYTKSGIINGVEPTMKKAVVTLKAGDTIDFYSNI